MRSIAVKLTFAFLGVSLTGAILMAIFMGLRTQSEFDRFVFARNQNVVVPLLEQYYRSHGSWEGLGAYFRGSGIARAFPSDRPILATVVDANRVVVFGGRPERIGVQVPERDLRNAVPLEVDGQLAGWLLFDWFRDRRLPQTPEAAFVGRLRQAIVWSALGATAVALVLGAMLARTLTRPVRELTAATHKVAQGELGLQVMIHSQDELGELALSFNRMSADLAQSTQLRRQMTADIAHDLRTPLSVILGYTEALVDGKLAGTPEMYEIMYGEAQHLNHLIDDLRTLSLADAGELPLYRQPVSARALLERTAAAHRIQAQEHAISLQIDTVPDLPQLNADPERMAQVLGNLVGNALRYTPEGGQVLLQASQQDDAILLRVHDDGPGIMPEDLPHIFERFYRGNVARRRNGESGLGLPIAKSIVQAHGGDLIAESAPGQGTTFTIRLPLQGGASV